MPARTHGASETPEYQAYTSAKNRCTNPRFVGYKHYGGRGIKFLFTSFEHFIQSIGARPTPEHYCVDRIKNSRHYEPGNVRWATRSEEMQNRRKFKNSTSDYFGVCWRKREQRWLAQLQINKKKLWLGLHATEIAAARAYDKAARKHFGANAQVNF